MDITSMNNLTLLLRKQVGFPFSTIHTRTHHFSVFRSFLTLGDSVGDSVGDSFFEDIGS